MQEFFRTIFGVAVVFFPAFLGLGNSSGACIEMVLLSGAFGNGFYNAISLERTRKGWRGRTFDESWFRILGFIFLLFFLFFLFLLTTFFLLIFASVLFIFTFLLILILYSKSAFHSF
jgi:hypothetical protein